VFGRGRGGQPPRAATPEGLIPARHPQEGIMTDRDSRVHAEHERDKAEQLLQQAARSPDPQEAERLRYRGEQLRERSEAVLQDEPHAEPGDVREEHPR
jgi:hypothetical protein